MQAFNFTAYPRDISQIEAIKAVIKAFKIKFTISTEKPYKSEFVKKLKESQQQFKDGKFSTIPLDEIWKKS
ncbi:MAG: hypothetical protein A3H98_13980 [Bacteroidetes bacterium RIFCSPLOWO2_02_FULL_36_8]|nr:MAG: hypothetical protein A3H98_13980 [Bacteroidetes bacterium RIFCSPLOWO2_02_FULL_36_8]OFY70258.1 MAG: hypothetical protein A3G23_08945 [Bacteroidetes bacterium RIFCSPLOWO2_12_FULL_37_12]